MAKKMAPRWHSSVQFLEMRRSITLPHLALLKIPRMIENGYPRVLHENLLYFEVPLESVFLDLCEVSNKETQDCLGKQIIFDVSLLIASDRYPHLSQQIKHFN